MQNHQYTSCYCEENVYLLLQELIKEKTENLTQYYAVILSNPFQQTHIQYQKNGDKNNGLVIWDYHVILIQRITIKTDKSINQQSYVYDFDSILPWRSNFEDYFKQALGFPKPNQALKTLFKVCEGNTFLKNFSSNRSHMIRNGKYLHKPPKYPCIKGELAKEDHLLSQFLDTNNNDFGKWLSEEQLWSSFQQKTI